MRSISDIVKMLSVKERMEHEALINECYAREAEINKSITKVTENILKFDKKVLKMTDDLLILKQIVIDMHDTVLEYAVRELPCNETKQ